jgi:hypothetical protein
LIALEKRSVASLQFDKASGRFRIRFYCGDTEYKRSLKTKEEGEALAVKVRVEETLRLIERGRLEIPPGADPARFILSDGKLNGKPVIEQALTLDDQFALYRKALPEGAKEKNTITTERLHCKHLLRILGSQIAVQSLGTEDFQKYADQRAQHKGERGNQKNHAAYLDYWVKAMSKDCRVIFRIASAASAAANFILSFSREEKAEGQAEAA